MCLENVGMAASTITSLRILQLPSVERRHGLDRVVPGPQKKMDIFVTEEARPCSGAVLGKSSLDLETRGDGHPLTETPAIPSLHEASTATRRPHAYSLTAR